MKILAQWLLAGLTILALLACNRDPMPTFEIMLAGGPLRKISPRVALARYVELAGEPDRLTLILASYDAGCAEFRPPPAGEVLVTVSVQALAGAGLTPGEYPWAGSLEAMQAADAPVAMPFVRLASEGRVLPAGGSLRLERLEPFLHGEVRGVLHFQDGGEGEPPSFRLVGPFRARLCQAALDPTRQADREARE